MSTLADGKRLAASEIGHDAHDYEHEHEHEHAERWLISYADLITTLMVFFLALYVLELAKDRDLQTRKFEAQVASARVQAATNTAADARKAARATLVALLKPLSDEHAITVTESTQGVEIAINAKVLFNSGDARLLPDSIDVLDRVGGLRRHRAWSPLSALRTNGRLTNIARRGEVVQPAVGRTGSQARASATNEAIASPKERRLASQA